MQRRQQNTVSKLLAPVSVMLSRACVRARSMHACLSVLLPVRVTHCVCFHTHKQRRQTIQSNHSICTKRKPVSAHALVSLCVCKYVRALYSLLYKIIGCSCLPITHVFSALTRHARTWPSAVARAQHATRGARTNYRAQRAGVL